MQAFRFTAVPTQKKASSIRTPVLILGRLERMGKTNAF